jgi:hypothetical protein
MPLVALLLLAALGAPKGSGAQASPPPVPTVAVIVHPESTLEGLTLDELVALCRLDRQHWRTGHRVYLILPESGTAEKKVLLERVYQMNDAALKQFWLEKLYRGEIAAFPHVEPSGGAARRLVARAPEALALVDAATVDSTVKVLRIDGRLPREAGYPLAGR